MRPRTSSSVLSFTFLLLFFFSAASAFNITRLLDQFPDFGYFNDLLTKTKLYEQINTRQTITVLALDNATVSAVAGNSLDVIKEILSVHVILDYYDIAKLRKLSEDKATVLTTMFQSTGDAVNQQGFLKVVLNNKGEIEFGSAAKGAPLNAKLVKAVAAQPYNISVLQVNAPLIIPGIGVYPSPPPPSAQVPVAAPEKAPAASPTPSADAPAPADDESDAPAADAPSPSEAEAPGAPVSSPPKPADDDADDAVAPAPADDDSAAPRGHIIGAGVVMGLLSLSMAF